MFESVFAINIVFEQCFLCFQGIMGDAGPSGPNGKDGTDVSFVKLGIYILSIMLLFIRFEMLLVSHQQISNFFLYFRVSRERKEESVDLDLLENL